MVGYFQRWVLVSDHLLDSNLSTLVKLSITLTLVWAIMWLQKPLVNNLLQVTTIPTSMEWNARVSSRIWMAN